jgi:deoxyadenosine/deoxycytidine kinase
MPTPTGELVPFYVAIAGNIGVGKTMVTDLLGERLGWDTYYEPVDDNPYLDDFYADMKRWSFHLQVFFLSKRFALQREIHATGRSAVQDRTIYEDTEIFARILYRRGSMDERDYRNYQELFAEMVTYLQPPDLILYLRAQPDAILQRIQDRGRDCEKGIEATYIRELHEAYELWAQRMHLIAAVHVIDTDSVNLRDDRKAQDDLVHRIRTASREKDLRGAAPPRAARAGGGPTGRQLA